MARTGQRKADRDEGGFTLIELMVVVLIIAILLAIAIPTFLGAQQRAADRGAQSDVRNAVTAARVVAVDATGLMTEVNVTSLSEAEGAITFGTTGTEEVVGVVKSSGDVPLGSSAVLLYKASTSGTYFGVVATKQGIIGYCAGPLQGDVDSIAGCTDDTW